MNVKSCVSKSALFFCFLFLFSCSGKVSTRAEYLKWLDNAKNGLSKTKYVNGMEIKIKYLPPEYLTYTEISRDGIPYSTTYKDSILGTYTNEISFMMTLGPDERKNQSGQDVMLSGVKNYSEYAAKSHTMNFDMEKFIRLKVNSEEYKPVLSAMENTYGLEAKRSIVFVFAPKDKTDKNFQKFDIMDFVYSDELFELGENHFLFSKNDIDKIPAFPFDAKN